jgi:hypothetical protein
VQVDSALPPSYQWENGERLFGFIQTERSVWDVSVQAPYRKFLGQIELSDSGWNVISINRQPYQSGVHHRNYTDAANALLHLAHNPVDQAGGRFGQRAVGVMVAVIAITTLAPGAIATEQGSAQTTQSEQPSLYRGSGR